MKILVGTLFIALAVFPNSVELSEGSSSGQPQEPHPDDLKPPPPVPGKDWIALHIRSQDVPTGLYYEDANRTLQPLPKPARIYELGQFLIGLVIGEKTVVPLFNKDHKVVMQNRFNPANQIEIGLMMAKEWGMPGDIQNVDAAVDRSRKKYKPTSEEMKRQAAEEERRQAAVNKHLQAAENERRQAAENKESRAAENQGKPTGRGGRHGKNRRA